MTNTFRLFICDLHSLLISMEGGGFFLWISMEFYVSWCWWCSENILILVFFCLLTFIRGQWFAVFLFEFIYAGITADEYKKRFICHHQSLLVSFRVCWVRPCLNGHGYVRRVDIEDDKCWRIFEVLTNQSDICGNFFLCSFWFGLLHVIKCDLMNSSSIKM